MLVDIHSMLHVRCLPPTCLTCHCLVAVETNLQVFSTEAQRIPCDRHPLSMVGSVSGRPQVTGGVTPAPSHVQLASSIPSRPLDEPGLVLILPRSLRGRSCIQARPQAGQLLVAGAERLAHSARAALSSPSARAVPAEQAVIDEVLPKQVDIHQVICVMPLCQSS